MFNQLKHLIFRLTAYNRLFIDAVCIRHIDSMLLITIFTLGIMFATSLANWIVILLH